MYDISIFALAAIFSGVDKVCDFGKEHHEEGFCVIILNVGHWFRRCGSKIFLSFL